MIASVENGSENNSVGKSEATASIEGLKSTTHFQSNGDVCLEGKIGSIHMLDLVPESQGKESNRIFALGESRTPDHDFATIFTRQGRGEDAFNFTLTRCGQDLALDLDTASLCYLHVPRFLFLFFYLC